VVINGAEPGSPLPYQHSTAVTRKEAVEEIRLTTSTRSAEKKLRTLRAGLEAFGLNQDLSAAECCELIAGVMAVNMCHREATAALCMGGLKLLLYHCRDSSRAFCRAVGRDPTVASIDRRDGIFRQLKVHP
jgi:hypothetical protein